MDTLLKLFLVVAIARVFWPVVRTLVEAIRDAAETPEGTGAPGSEREAARAPDAWGEGPTAVHPGRRLTNARWSFGRAPARRRRARNRWRSRRAA